MKRRLLFRPRAEANLLEARTWYDERQPGLGAEFVASVERAIEQIVDSPLAFPRVHGEKRRAILRRFPYAVLFQVLSDEVIILAVVHGRRDPRHLQYLA